MEYCIFDSTAWTEVVLYLAPATLLSWNRPTTWRWQADYQITAVDSTPSLREHEGLLQESGKRSASGFRSNSASVTLSLAPHFLACIFHFLYRMIHMIKPSRNRAVGTVNVFDMGFPFGFLFSLDSSLQSRWLDFSPDYL